MCSKSLLSCPLCCQSIFPNIESLKRNLIKVNCKPIKCPFPYCDEVLLGLDKLTIHLFSHSLLSDNEDDLVVPVANKKEEKKKSGNNRKYKTGKKKNSTASPYTVDTGSCDSTVSFQSNPEYNCDYCGFQFKDQNLRDMHLNLVHNVDPNENVFPVKREPQDFDCGNRKQKCHLCNKSFKMKGSLRIHMKVAHIGFQDQDEKLNICDYLKRQMVVSEPNPSPMYVGTTEQETSRTNQTHHSPNPHHTISQQIIHSPIQHNDSNDGNLNQKSTATNDNNSNNFKSNNSTSKSWECDVCSKTFTTKYFLKKHKRLHTGEMPYCCSLCNKTFTFQQSYHKHLMYHNDDKPYVCNICGRAFKELSTLHNHERIHSGEKPYSCETCSKSFRQRVSYLVHRRIHTGIMPYKCSICDKSFRYKVSQRNHKCNGVFVRQQTGDLLKKLIQNSLILSQNELNENPNESNNRKCAVTETATTNTLSMVESESPMITVTTLMSSTLTPTTTTTSATFSNISFNEHLKHDNEEQEICLDRLVEESYNKIIIGNDNDTIKAITSSNAASPSSPLMSNAMLQNNCLSLHNSNSHTNNNIPINFPGLEIINEDSIKELLYGNAS